ncbi:hypothetical protein C8R47DRAFT_1324489 [Mycena vitilis]|nr:hypothetical protein C8R47DRAFT_1324489 [Mycena vitilis]
MSGNRIIRPDATLATSHHDLMTIPRIHRLEPVFPRELEREMFETTALMHPGQILSLLRIARRVLLWIEPLLYRIIHSTGDLNVTNGILHTLAVKPPEFFHAVRHLGLDSPDFTSDTNMKLLRLCKKATSFSARRQCLDAAFLPLLAGMRIQQLGVNLGVLFNGTIDLQHGLFRYITHLDMFGTEGVVGALPNLPTLPALTHLCLPNGILRDDALRALSECSRLNVLLIQWPMMEEDDYMDEQIPHVYDIRFVIGTYGDYWDDWVAGAKGFPDAWSKADDFVARKRKGEIEATRYWID